MSSENNGDFALYRAPDLVRIQFSPHSSQRQSNALDDRSAGYTRSHSGHDTNPNQNNAGQHIDNHVWGGSYGIRFGNGQVVTHGSRYNNSFTATWPGGRNNNHESSVSRGFRGSYLYNTRVATAVAEAMALDSCPAATPRATTTSCLLTRTRLFAADTGFNAAVVMMTDGRVGTRANNFDQYLEFTGQHTHGGRGCDGHPGNEHEPPRGYGDVFGAMPRAWEWKSDDCRDFPEQSSESGLPLGYGWGFPEDGGDGCVSLDNVDEGHESEHVGSSDDSGEDSEGDDLEEDGEEEGGECDEYHYYDDDDDDD